MTWTSIYADLHIHIGRTQSGLPVKISAARDMTFAQIIREAYGRKGIQMIGIIDAHSPPVQAEIAQGLQSGIYREHADGGIVYQGTTCILGAEIEVREPGMGPAHVLVYFPTLSLISQFTTWLSPYMKNVQLSTQRLHAPVRVLQAKVTELGGIFIPAHVFTPFKGVYGSVSSRMAHLFDLSSIIGVELGLSADSTLADHISELAPFSFVTNSDAHSIPKIGREYNELWVKGASFQELKLALTRQGGRKIIANYGLDPRLGKYYRTRCCLCGERWPTSVSSEQCPSCGSGKKIKGVRDRIHEIADQKMNHPFHRAPYVYQVPLQFIPKLGKKTLDKLLAAFGTEMNVLHQVPIEEIAHVANEEIAHYMDVARKQRLEIEEGGGGVYGKVRQG
jgi:uncharacterized protein (TIGR00375 family)